MSMLIWSTSLRPFHSTAITSFPETGTCLVSFTSLSPPYAHPGGPSSFFSFRTLKPQMGARPSRPLPTLPLPLPLLIAYFLLHPHSPQIFVRRHNNAELNQEQHTWKKCSVALFTVVYMEGPVAGFWEENTSPFDPEESLRVSVQECTGAELFLYYVPANKGRTSPGASFPTCWLYYL